MYRRKMNFKRRREFILILSGIIILILSAFLMLFKSDIKSYAATAFSGGNGTAASPYKISNVNDFCALADINTQPTLNGYFGCYFELTADIDLNGVNLEPIGTSIYPFKGQLNGLGHSINNISMNSSADYVGLFGTINSNSRISNLTISGSVVGDSDIGGLVGRNQGSINNCVNNATVSSTNAVIGNVGGICGFNESDISNCYNRGNISSKGIDAGGITGINSVGEIKQCFNVGTVSSDSYSAGGIAGNNYAKIKECFNSGAITSYNTAGGICGANNSTGTIENTYNTATITVSTDVAGGICGSNDDGKVFNSYNCANIVGGTQLGGICGYISNNGWLFNCFFASDKFSGKMTFRGNSYSNSKVLRAVDMVNSDALSNENKMKALSESAGAEFWTKQNFDTSYCYLPELISFKNSVDSVIKNYSKESVKIARQTPDVQLEEVEYVYDGKYFEPAVYIGEEKLSLNLDYTIEYKNNFNAGAKDEAVAKITFLNFYKGTNTKYFTISKKEITVEWSNEKFKYSGEVQHPTVTVTSGKVGDENITFSYSYDSNVKAGTHTVSAHLESTNAVNANYFFSQQTKEYEIYAKDIGIEWSKEPLYYNGKAQHPQAQITDEELSKDTINLIYSAFEQNINAGKNYKVNVESENSDYYLKEECIYSIEKQPLSAYFEEKEFYYNGINQFPEISQVNGIIGEELVTFIYSGNKDNIDAGKQYVVTAFLAYTEVNSNYSLSDTSTIYEIKRQPLTIQFDNEILVYNGKAQYPEFYITSGIINNENVELEFTDYKDNINSTNGDSYSITVTLANTDVNHNYYLNPVTKYYGIAKSELTIEWADTILIYNGQAQRPAFNIVSGVINNESIEFDVSDYSNNINAIENNDYCITVSLSNAEVNKNYCFKPVTKYYGIKKLGTIIEWDIHSLPLRYNGRYQHPLAVIVSEIYDELKIIYGECLSVTVGENYSIPIALNNSNYKIINSLNYNIEKALIEIEWENSSLPLVYNGRIQHPIAKIVTEVYDQVELLYKNCESSFAGQDYVISILPNNKNYEIINELKYDIDKAEIEIDWDKNSLPLIYNGQTQHPIVIIKSNVYDEVKILYGDCLSLNAGLNYEIPISLNNENYFITNKLVYSILQKELDFVWEATPLYYNGQIQYPKGELSGIINDEQVSFKYYGFELSFDVGVNYSVYIELDSDNYVNENYYLNKETVKTNYCINSKEVELTEFSLVDRPYDMSLNLEVKVGEIIGIEKDDNVEFKIEKIKLLDPNAGNNKEIYLDAGLIGEYAYRYRLILPILTVNISKAIFKSSNLIFDSKTFLYDGKPKSLFAEGEIPEDIKIIYKGNEQADIGENTVIAHFVYNECNYEHIDDLSAKLYISPQEYFTESGNITVKIVSGCIEYGCELVVENLNGKLVKDKNKDNSLNVIKGFRISFKKCGLYIQPEGVVNIVIQLDDEIYGQKGLTLFELRKNKLSKKEFTSNNETISFDTDYMTDFYFAAKKSYVLLWVCIGSSMALIAGIVVCTILTIKGKLFKKPVKSVNASANDAIIDYQKPICSKKEPQKTEREIGFNLDGVYCKSMTSFLASLNYKNISRQKEICSMSAENAKKFAAGKGNGKRLDLYWLGKNYIKNSKEYSELLERARSQAF